MIRVYGHEAVEVEQPDGELVPYLLEAVEPDRDERSAWTLTRPEPDRKTGATVRYRVALNRARGWVCTCGDWLHCTRHRRGRLAGSPCKHQAAIMRYLAESDHVAPGRRVGDATGPGAGERPALQR